MDEAIGQRFAIVRRGRPARWPEDQRRHGADVGLDWLGERGARAAILRPDRYIFALARDRGELEAAVVALAGSLAPA